MSRGVYELRQEHRAGLKRKPIVAAIIVVIALGVAGGILFKPDDAPSISRKAGLEFDASVSGAEKQLIQKAGTNQPSNMKGVSSVRVATAADASEGVTMEAYVPVTNVYATKQAVTQKDLQNTTVYLPKNTESKVREAIAKAVNLEPSKLQLLSSPLEKIGSDEVALVPISQLSAQIKLLGFNDAYYLDSFQKGAIFRQAVFTGGDTAKLANLRFNGQPTKDTTLKVNMTGVTAITRLMMKKLNTVKDPVYFSKDIGSYLADADITHISNEVSFMQNCQYSDTAFCAPMDSIETLKASGVDLVELTGNHNNDRGSEYNTETIQRYHELGWSTFGGGLNSTEAAKPYVADKKNSKVTFLGYNYPDSPNGGPIAGPSKAGANSFDFDKIKADIQKAKQQSNFVIVDVQFWECYAYPGGYVEFPECDRPISGQTETFRKIADLGADMVIGTQAHQPQTYELYKGTPIYYGLGNLYFDQTQWPGTERGIILSHYFVGGKLLQTKLSPTVYDQALQTRLMDNTQATTLLERLKAARDSSL